MKARLSNTKTNRPSSRCSRSGQISSSSPGLGPLRAWTWTVVSNGVALVRLQTSADGRFAVYVPPGIYTIRATRRPGTVVKVSVSEGRLASASLTVDPGGC